MRKTLAATAALMLVAAPALAEPKFEGLGRDLAVFALIVMAYLALVVGLITTAVLRKWRAFLICAVGGFVILVIYPLIDTTLLRWQVAQVRADESVKAAPDLTQKNILLVRDRQQCHRDVCSAFYQLGGEALIWVLPLQDLEALPAGQPIDLRDVPLKQYAPATEDGTYGILWQTPVAGAVRPVFDYIVIAREPSHRTFAGPLEDRLSLIPTGTGLGKRLALDMLAAPIDANTLDLATLSPDLLHFYVNRKARRAPLYLEHTVSGNRRGSEWYVARRDWLCGTGEDTARAQCRREMN